MGFPAKYIATDLLAKIKTVDGDGSGLDADLLDGHHASYFALATSVNNIGVPGTQGFGVGICPSIPNGFFELSGTRDPASDNYGNYQYSDGSVMVWVPAFYYLYGTGSNGLGINVVDIKPFTYFTSITAANAAGYVLHRAFYNAGAVQPGLFVDKYLCSKNGSIASSIKNGAPLSSNAAHNPFSGVGGYANFYYGAINVVKSRGSNFFCCTQFIRSALALLSLSHAQAATGSAFCAWYDAAGVTNFPKGCNNNALGDINDPALAFTSDGYSNSAKTGSANFFARTTHNGQNSGIADLNGCMWEISPGIVSDGANFYVLKTSVDVRSITSGNTLATDAWGAAGIAAMYDSIGATYGALTASNSLKSLGSGAQVFSGDASGAAWGATGAGIPLVGGTGGANLFGNDGLWDYRPNELCPFAGSNWGSGNGAGVWALHLGDVRGNSSGSVGCRAALYL